MIDIYEALKSGQTPDAIAQAFVDELNAAIAKQEADKAAAEEAARAQAQKDKDTQAVVDCINGYLFSSLFCGSLLCGSLLRYS